MNGRHAVLTAAMALGPCADAALAGRTAEFIPLGFLDPKGFGPVIGYGISADGRVVVGDAVSPLGFEAFRWTDASGMVGLGALDNPRGFRSSHARSCSADGSIIVGASMRPDSLNEDGSPFLWTASGGMQYLGTLGDSSGGVAHDVSSDGSVVVGYSSFPEFTIQAFRWTSGDGMVGLGDLQGGMFRSKATAVSGDGTVVIGVGTLSAGSALDRAFKWTHESGMLPLGPSTFFPIGLSRDGAYAVGTNLGRAARVDMSSGRVFTIPHVPIPGLNTDTDTAWAASSDGSVVVGMQNLSLINGFFGRAFVWDAQRGARILRDVLINEFGLGNQLLGWELNAATTVSDDGLSIAGYGFAPSGEQAGWLIRFIESCPPDITDDGAVDVDDLLAVINGWAAPAPHPADVDSDGLVNVDDLLAVINGWGVCG